MIPWKHLAHPISFIEFFVKHSRFASKSMQQDQRHKAIPMFFLVKFEGLTKNRHMLRNTRMRVTSSSSRWWWCFMNSECYITQGRNHSQQHKVGYGFANHGKLLLATLTSLPTRNDYVDHLVWRIIFDKNIIKITILIF